VEQHPVRRQRPAGERPGPEAQVLAQSNRGVSKAALFGSFARGEARLDTDLDILVDLDDTERGVAVEEAPMSFRADARKSAAEARRPVVLLPLQHGLERQIYFNACRDALARDCRPVQMIVE